MVRLFLDLKVEFFPGLFDSFEFAASDEALVTLRETLVQTHNALLNAGVDHALIGGMALALWGLNRATGDVDLLVEATQREAAESALRNLGFQVFASTKEVLQLQGPGKVDILFAQRSLSRKMLADAKVLPNIGLKYVLAEDLIGLKIQAYKNDPRRELQDKADIQNLMRKNSGLDYDRMKQYADLFGEWETLELLRRGL
jgi:predicted nucleotidyltransferase